MREHVAAHVASVDSPPMRYVYDFDEDSGGGRELLGGKGIGLAEMTALGVPVPAGFTITTDACRAYMASGGELPDGLDAEVAEHIAALEAKAGKRFGDPDDPLLVSVRSGAAVSMPGMMDTILNLGLNDEAVAGLAKTTGNERFAYDSYRRLIQMYGEVVDGVEGHRFEQALTDLKAARGVKQDVELDGDGPGRADRDLQADLRRGDGQPVPAGRARAARAGRARRLRLLGLAARAGLPAHVRDPGRPRHRRQRRPDGLRQQGRQLRHRRLLHARPVDRREPALRRVPPERAGRGRRRRHPHARADRAHGRAAAGGVRAAARDDPPARGALPRHAGHRVHGRGGDALPAPDAHGEADGGGGAPRGGRDGRGGADLEGGGGRPDRPGAARPAAAPDDRPGRRGRGRREGPERLARRGVRRDRLRRRHRRGARQGGRERDPRPLGDDAGRLPRDGAGGRDPDRARRARPRTPRSSRAGWGRPA